MSFLKKLTKEFEELKTSLTGDKSEGNRKDSKDHGHQSAPHQGPPPPGQSGYGGGPPLPPGWTSQFDNNSQRWYYIEQATGRTQWDFPGHSPPPPSGGYHAPPPGQNYGQQRGYDQHAYAGPSQYGGPHAAPYGAPQYGHPGGSHYPVEETKKKDKGNKNMMMAGAGGLAAGAVGGALVANALDDSDDEHHSHAPAQSYGAPPGAGYGGLQMPPPVLPPTDADGDSVSSSDREDVQEARADYEEALADAHDSDASSSDHERLEEAREEYQEEYEEAYDD